MWLLPTLKRLGQDVAALTTNVSVHSAKDNIMLILTKIVLTFDRQCVFPCTFYFFRPLKGLCVFKGESEMNCTTACKNKLTYSARKTSDAHETFRSTDNLRERDSCLRRRGRTFSTFAVRLLSTPVEQEVRQLRIETTRWLYDSNHRGSDRTHCRVLQNRGSPANEVTVRKRTKNFVEGTKYKIRFLAPLIYPTKLILFKKKKVRISTEDLDVFENC